MVGGNGGNGGKHSRLLFLVAVGGKLEARVGEQPSRPSRADPYCCSIDPGANVQTRIVIGFPLGTICMAISNQQGKTVSPSFSDRPFSDRLAASVQAKRSAVMVGLDPRWESLPAALLTGGDDSYAAKAVAFEKFCTGIIDAVAAHVAVVKPQAAFFEELGPAGMLALANVIDHAAAAGLLVILDGKRNDIGTTAEAYARAHLGQKPQSPWGADALTVSPYLGDDSLEPFVRIAKERSAGIFVLVKTSNPGGKRFQDLDVGGRMMFEEVGACVNDLAKETIATCGYGAIGAVVGATYPQQLESLRAAMPQTWFLIPGYGAQGGGAKDCAAAFDSNGLGAIINNSRGINFAFSAPAYHDRFGESKWQAAAEAATIDMNNLLRSETPAGKL